MSKNNDTSKRRQPPPIVSNQRQRLDERREHRAEVARGKFRTVTDGEPSESSDEGEGS